MFLKRNTFGMWCAVFYLIFSINSLRVIKSFLYTREDAHACRTSSSATKQHRPGG